MKYFFKLVAVFFLIFVLKSIFASNTLAATIQGVLSNTAGSNTVTVSISVKDQNGNLTGSAFSQPIGPGSSYNLLATDIANVNSTDFPTLTWFTSCDTGSATTTAIGSGIYKFNDLDVHCRKTNSALVVTSTNCTGGDGQINWTVTPGSGGANIAYFRVYKVLQSSGLDPETDSNWVQVAYSGTNNYSLPNVGLPNALKTLATGTWILRVKAFTNAPDSNSIYKDGQFTCPGWFTPPSNLNANINCTNPSPIQFRVDFSWTAASPGNYTYVVETNSTGASGPWPGTFFTPSPNTNTFYSISGNTFSAGTHYYWRVKATEDVVNGKSSYSNNSDFLMPTTCPANIPAASLATDICYGGSSSQPNDINFRWTRATPNGLIQAEKLEYSTNPLFPQDSSTVGILLPSQSGIGGNYHPVPFINFVTGTRYYWRISSQMVNNLWYPSIIRDFTVVYTCILGGGASSGGFPGAPILYGYSYCDGATSKIFLYWSGGSGSYNWIWVNGGTNYQTQYVPYSTIITTGGSSFLYKVSSRYSAPYYDVFSNEIWIAGAVCGGMAPSAPNNLRAVTTLGSSTFGCNSSNLPSVDLKFNDNASDETGYALEISTEPFTGDTTTNPSNMWGLKSLSANSTSFTWSNASSANYLDLANANPGIPPGQERVPIEETTYYWRVKATGTSGPSNYVYPDGTVASTVYAAGLPFRIPLCLLGYDLKVTMVPGSMHKHSDPGFATNIFLAGDIVNVDYKIENLKSSQPTSLATNLYFYYKSENMPSCVAPPGTSTPDLSVVGPDDGGSPANKQKYPVVEIPLGGSVTVTVQFDVGTSVGTFTGAAYVIPDCNPGVGLNEYKWTNNNSALSGGASATYNVDVKRFFEAIGGDVGTKGTISVGVDSSLLTGSYGPKYQSQYLAAGGQIGGKVSVAPISGFKLNNYGKPLVSGGGVYNYLASKFRKKATTPMCSISSGAYDGYFFCAGDMTIQGVNTMTLTGKSVFFVDGNLRIDSNINSTGDNAVIFIVKGNITVNTSNLNPSGSWITRLDGMYVARKGFADTHAEFGGQSWLFGTTSGLTINGGLYVDAEDGTNVNLQRYMLISAQNAVIPTDIFKFDPKYTILLSALLAGSPVGWQEVAP